MIEDAKEAIQVFLWLQKHWERRSTLVILLALIFSLGLFLSYNFDLASLPQTISLAEVSLVFLLSFFVVVIWHVSRKPPTTPEDKIGIAIAINCETRKERARLKADFVNALCDEIKRGSHQHFHVFELSEYHSEKIKSFEDAKKYQRLTRSHLLIYGQCRSRTHEGKPTYVLDLHASVLHLPVPAAASTRLGQDMNRVFPRQALIPESDEVMGFHLTKDIVRQAARFTLGAASLISQDPITAFDLHHGLWREIKELIEMDENIFPGYKYIGNKLPNLLIMEGLLSLRFYYISKPPNYLAAISRYLDVVQEIDPRNYDAHLFRGIYYFLHDHDVEKAKKEIKKAKNDRNAASQYSAAFLAAYEGDLVQAHKIYQRAFRGQVTSETPLDVEIFIQDVLEAEPDKIQLWYCLGMINYFCKGDSASARNDFSQFITLASRHNKFPSSIIFAKKYLEEIGT